MDMLEFIKAIAPYVTALVAVLVAAFTAWLSHRNWIKQFKIQRSESILKEQIRLLQEVPKTLNDAVRLVAHTVWALACSDAFARAKIPEFANPLMKDRTEYQAKLTDLLAELEVPEVSVRLYFGEEAGKYFGTCRNLLTESVVRSAPHIAEVTSLVEQQLRNTDLASVDMNALIGRLMLTVMPVIEQAFAVSKEARFALIRAMAARVTPNEA
jgi:hypothetical protein